MGLRVRAGVPERLDVGDEVVVVVVPEPAAGLVGARRARFDRRFPLSSASSPGISSPSADAAADPLAARFLLSVSDLEEEDTSEEEEEEGALRLREAAKAEIAHRALGGSVLPSDNADVTDASSPSPSW